MKEYISKLPLTSRERVVSELEEIENKISELDRFLSFDDPSSIDSIEGCWQLVYQRDILGDYQSCLSNRLKYIDRLSELKIKRDKAKK